MLLHDDNATYTYICYVKPLAPIEDKYFCPSNPKLEKRLFMAIATEPTSVLAMAMAIVYAMLYDKIQTAFGMNLKTVFIWLMPWKSESL